MLKFVEAVPIEDVKASVYNPRKITKEAIDRLMESIQKLGIIKPLIVNSANGVIVAGHQRHKASTLLGLKTLPCIYIRSNNAQEEIIFNVTHNQVEESTASVKVTGGIPGRFTYIDKDNISITEDFEIPAHLNAMTSLLSKYGEWGSIICDEDGNVLFNSEYAYIAKKTGYGCLCYTLSSDKRETALHYLSKEYGTYCYDNLPIKTYHQSLAQMPRLGTGKYRANYSGLYERFVIPDLKPGQRLFDLGAGKKAYVKLMRSKGYDMDCYEPGLRGNSGNSFDVRQVVKDIQEAQRSIAARGLYDVVVLDSVLNSVVDDTFEDIVVMVCNALCRTSGTLYVATRSMKELEIMQDRKRSRSGARSSIYALDDKGYKLSVKYGIAYKQKLHTADSLTSLLSRYFTEVEIQPDIIYNRGIVATARQPRKLDLQKLEWAMKEEFNIEYPGGYQHNRHMGLVQAILEQVRNRDGA